jgi:hypothetical protein
MSSQLPWGPGRPYKTREEFTDAVETLESLAGMDHREAYRTAGEKRIESIPIVAKGLEQARRYGEEMVGKSVETPDLEIRDPMEDLESKGLTEVSRVMLLQDPKNRFKNPFLEALSHKRGRKPYFLGEDGVFKQDVIDYVVALWRNGIRDVASICKAVYHRFKHFNYSKQRWEPLRLRARTVLKWLYFYGLIKPGISLVQRVFRRIPIKVGAEREAEREKEVYGKEKGWLRFQRIAMDILGLSYEDSAVYWMQLNSVG